ncbi:Ppx/GppA family phosphatase [Sphingomonas xanthus]|uniref:Ppx/GppA family phosphatase n=1 Tax=Sphingomonas xanthus TaxID=2594473 RepID=A0A516ITS1_9SPHN|nr:Ppx/GppA family phosphatase [Sphingomonas xanthus]QDP20271.1 Ppx/GppA family phosphatase [Sphingomonas xanthus]
MTRRNFGPVGIIDIGSNSVRFVAYGGTARVPSVLFNEKVMAALGRGLAQDGRLDERAMRTTLESLARFRQLGREMGLKKLHAVATAAVRDAENGPAFLKEIAALGLKPRLLSGAEEAELAGLGVISAIPRANGIVADLGGGSLELIGVARGMTGDAISLPLGVLRIGASPSGSDLDTAIKVGLRNAGRLADAARGQGLYCVGGSFRALARLDLLTLGHPLPMVHQHRFLPKRLDDLRGILKLTAPDELKRMTAITASRIPTLPAVVTMLEAMMEVLGPKKVIVSAFGLREGLLYRDLDEATRRQDPLLAAALEVGERLGRFGDHGAALEQWLAPLFPDDSSELQRLRLATCLLGDIAWNAHPDFRAERAVDMAIHGNWVGIGDHGRAVMGRALCAAFGGDGGFDAKLSALLRPGEEERLIAWGKALRLAQRLSGGTEALLRKTQVGLRGDRLVLTIPGKYRLLYSEPVERRFNQLAKALDRRPDICFA